MGGRRRPSLVAELGRLLVEYPEKDWRALANRLRDREFVEDIAAAIDDALALRASPIEKTRKVRQPARDNVIAKVALVDRAKAERLSALKSRLMDRDARLPFAYIRSFASSLGIKEDLSNRRDRAVNEIVRHLADKTNDEIDGIVKAALLSQPAEGQEFDRWVKLILGDNTPKEGE